MGDAQKTAVSRSYWRTVRIVDCPVTFRTSSENNFIQTKQLEHNANPIRPLEEIIFPRFHSDFDWVPIFLSQTASDLWWRAKYVPDLMMMDAGQSIDLE